MPDTPDLAAARDRDLADLTIKVDANRRAINALGLRTAERFDRVEGRLDRVEGRLGTLESEVRMGFAQMRHGFDQTAAGFARIAARDDDR